MKVIWTLNTFWGDKVVKLWEKPYEKEKEIEEDQNEMRRFDNHINFEDTVDQKVGLI